MKSDVYPPKHFVGWDTVAVLEEMEAEEVHFHKNNTHVRMFILSWFIRMSEILEAVLG